MPTNVIMPALELAQETGKVLRWLKAPGDRVAKGALRPSFTRLLPPLVMKCPSRAIVACTRASPLLTRSLIRSRSLCGAPHNERDLIRERVKSGLAAARARGVVLGRQVGQRPSDKKAKRVLAMHRDGLSYRLIGRNLGLSKNTVMEIIRRAAA